MTTRATQIRDAIMTRLSGLDYTTFRKTAVPQIQPEQLPVLSVYITREDLRPDGDANAGDPHFMAAATIAISVIRGFDDPAALDGSIDSDVDDIESALMTDPTFVTFNPKAMLFESVDSIQRRRVFPQTGETYLCELRLEIVFGYRVAYEPKLLDDFLEIDIETRPLANADAPRVKTKIVIDQE